MSILHRAVAETQKETRARMIVTKEQLESILPLAKLADKEVQRFLFALVKTVEGASSALQEEYDYDKWDEEKYSGLVEGVLKGKHDEEVSHRFINSSQPQNSPMGKFWQLIVA